MTARTADMDPRTVALIGGVAVTLQLQSELFCSWMQALGNIGSVGTDAERAGDGPVVDLLIAQINALALDHADCLESCPQRVFYAAAVRAIQHGRDARRTAS